MKKRYGFLLFIVALAIGLAGSVMLVVNRQSAAAQAKQIVANDQAGTNVETDMLKLKTYAATHMKVNIQFTLAGSYDRAVAAAKAAVQQPKQVYAAAQAACDKQGVDSVRQSQCVSAYVAANGNPVVAQPILPDKAKYAYHYVGPAWSFDMPGVLFVLSGFLAIGALVSIIHRTVTK